MRVIVARNEWIVDVPIAQRPETSDSIYNEEKTAIPTTLSPQKMPEAAAKSPKPA